MPYTDDEFATIIQTAIGPEGDPVARHQRPAAQAHQVLWFALGLGVFLADGILLYLLAWFLRHG